MRTEKEIPRKKIGCKLTLGVPLSISSRPRPTIDKLIKIIEGGEPTERTHSAIDLIEYGKEALPQSIRLLRTGRNSSKQIAAWVLGDIGGEEALKALEEYKDHPNRNVRMSVTSAIESITGGSRKSDQHYMVSSG
jgi:HEAT repeat protein